MKALKENWLIVGLVGVIAYFLLGDEGEGEASTGTLSSLYEWSTGGTEYTYHTLLMCFGGDAQWMNFFLVGVLLVSVSYIMIIRQFLAVRKVVLRSPQEELQRKAEMDEEAFEEYRKRVVEAIEGLMIIFGLCLLMGYGFYILETQYPIKRLHTVVMYAHAAWCFRYVHLNHITLFMNALRIGLHRG